MCMSHIHKCKYILRPIIVSMNTLKQNTLYFLTLYLRSTGTSERTFYKLICRCRDESHEIMNATPLVAMKSDYSYSILTSFSRATPTRFHVWQIITSTRKISSAHLWSNFKEDNLLKVG